MQQNTLLAVLLSLLFAFLASLWFFAGFLIWISAVLFAFPASLIVDIHEVSFDFHLHFAKLSRFGCLAVCCTGEKGESRKKP